MRPGFLAGFEGMVPNEKRRKLIKRQQSGPSPLGSTYNVRYGNYPNAGFDGFGGYGRLGNFGKGYQMGPPPPSDAPIKPSQTVDSDEAVDAKTKNFYRQDVRCPPGEKMVQRPGGPCEGADCDPGEMEPPYSECDDDPAYMELPGEPPGGFQSCDERAAKLYPAPCNKQTCPTCFQPKQKQSQPKQDQEVAPTQIVMIAPPMMVAPPMDPAFQAEIEALEMEASRMPTSVVNPEEALYSGPAYTGSAAPSVPSSLVKRGGPTQESKLEQLVSQHEEAKLITRYSSPVQVRPSYIPRSGPPPRRGAPPPQRPSGNQGLIGWLRDKLFG